MAETKSCKVPKAMTATYVAITAATDGFCREYLDAEYAELARRTVAALCRKRPSPLASGQPRTWACAVLYALGQVNFLSDKSFAPTMRLADLCARFGVGASTGGNKAKVVRDALDMDRLSFEWMLPSRSRKNPLAFMVSIDGWPVDIRTLPIAFQELAVAAGLVPCVVPPSEPDVGDVGNRKRKPSRSDFAERALRLLAGPGQADDGAVDDRAQVDLLLSALGRCLPLAAKAVPAIVPSLREIFGTADLPLEWQVSRLDYSGDEGGIMCHIEGGAGSSDHIVVVSITCLDFDDATPCAREIAAYQRHRRERLHLAAA